MTVEEFRKEITTTIDAFVSNMNNLSFYKEGMSFPKWYELFGRWLEVGTDMENEYWDEK
jgi:hypothetical protein